MDVEQATQAQHHPGPNTGTAAAARPLMTPEYVEYYIQRGRELRSVYAWWMLRRLGRGMRNAVRGPRRRRQKSRETDDSNPLDSVAGQLRTPLAAIRSSAEILRDHPNISQQDRDRFLDTMLAEEARLERLLNGILAASDFKREAGVWQVPIDELRLPNR